MAQLNDTTVSGTLMVNDVNINEKMELVDELSSNYVVEFGIYKNWYYKKWSNGDCECWSRINFSSTSTNNTFTVSLPFDFASTTFYVLALPARNGSLVTGYGDYNSVSNITHTVNSFEFTYKMSSIYNVSFNFIVKGMWK